MATQQAPASAGTSVSTKDHNLTIHLRDEITIKAGQPDNGREIEIPASAFEVFASGDEGSINRAHALFYNPVEDEHEHIDFEGGNYVYKGQAYEFMSVYKAD